MKNLDKSKLKKKPSHSKLAKQFLDQTEKDFVELYFSQNSHVFGNGVQSVIEALGEDYFTNKKTGLLNYSLAGVTAHDWLKKPKIYDAGNKILEKEGFNDSSVDTQHSFLINQHADLSVKQRSIDMYNKLKGRYEKDNKQVGDSIAKALSKIQETLGESEIS